MSFTLGFDYLMHVVLFFHERKTRLELATFDFPSILSANNGKDDALPVELLPQGLWLLVVPQLLGDFNLNRNSQAAKPQLLILYLFALKYRML